MAYNFKYSLIITGTSSQLSSISNSLTELGYTGSKDFPWVENDAILTSNKDGRWGIHVLTSKGLKQEYTDTTRLSTSTHSEECILAIAAVRVEGDFQEGEWVKCITTSWNDDYTNKHLYKVITENGGSISAIDNKGKINGFANKHFVRPTMEEIIAHFSKNKPFSMEVVMPENPPEYVRGTFSVTQNKTMPKEEAVGWMNAWAKLYDSPDATNPTISVTYVAPPLSFSDRGHFANVSCNKEHWNIAFYHKSPGEKSEPLETIQISVADQTNTTVWIGGFQDILAIKSIAANALSILKDVYQPDFTTEEKDNLELSIKELETLLSHFK